MSAIFDGLSVVRPWCDPLKKEALLWHSSKHLGSQTLIHLIDQGGASIRCVVLTKSWGVTKLKLKFQTLFFQYWHHTQNEQCSVVSASIDHDAIHWMRKLFLALFQTSWISNLKPSGWLGQSFDQRCSVKKIMIRVTKLKLKFLTLFFQYWHHASQC